MYNDSSEGAEKRQRRKIKELEVMVAEVRREGPETATLVLFTGNDSLDYKPGHRARRVRILSGDNLEGSRITLGLGYRF